MEDGSRGFVVDISRLGLILCKNFIVIGDLLRVNNGG